MTSEELYNEYSKYAQRVAFNYARTNDEAKDLAQDALLTLVEKYERGYSKGKEHHFHNWCKRIIRNKLMDFQRRKNTKESVWSFGYKSDVRAVTEEAQCDDGPENYAYERFTRENYKNVLLAIRQLSPVQREMMYRNYIQQQKYREIAKAMNTQIGTVKSNIGRARKNIVKILGRTPETFE